MTEERSTKITEALPPDPFDRRRIARTLIECLVAHPLFSAEESAVFHADPHAGNIRITGHTGDIVVLDWALTDSLTVTERRHLLLVLLAVPLRDEGQMSKALCQLCPSSSKQTLELIEREVEGFVDALPFGTIPDSSSLTDLVGRLLRAGIRFSSPFLIFRKMLMTLEDLIEEIAPGTSIASIIAIYALRRSVRSAISPGGGSETFRLPLNSSDIFGFGLSARFFPERLCLQTIRSSARCIAADLPKHLKAVARRTTRLKNAN